MIILHYLKEKGKMGAYAMKRLAAGAHLQLLDIFPENEA